MYVSVLGGDRVKCKKHFCTFLPLNQFSFIRDTHVLGGTRHNKPEKPNSLV